MHILLAEDDEDHALLTIRALRRAQPAMDERLTFAVVSDGAAVLAHLRGEAPDAGLRLPDLLLLDLKMPGMGGLDVLQALRDDPSLRTLPVIVLTTSVRDKDVEGAYRLGANEYVIKPASPEEFRTKVQRIPEYWSQVVQRPPHSPSGTALMSRPARRTR